MEIYSENNIRQLHLKGHETEINIHSEDYITPEALAYICDKRLTLKINGRVQIENGHMAGNEKRTASIRVVPGCPRSGNGKKKPDYMTHLNGNMVVPKTDPKIVFRGKLDSLCAKIVEMSIHPAIHSNSELVFKLDELEELCRKIMVCEVTGRAMDTYTLFSKTLDELHEISHNPMKTMGTGHIRVNRQCSEECILLNSLRTAIRECELSLVAATINAEGVLERPDLLHVMNRMSSAVYVLMMEVEKTAGGEGER